ncbi:MAG: class I SAM-dependent methyltransferase [Acidimicrobiales bacterium]
MAGIDHNRAVWTDTWDWSGRGDEWSQWWGGTEAMWFGALLPRIHAFVPTGTVLEIAPGYGRWTQYLQGLADRLVIVDLAENCIEHCRQRFVDATNVEYHVNDGRSLDMIADRSIDLAFSFDSLVHVDADVVGAYLDQLSRKLTPDGVGFLHHSNAGAYPVLTSVARHTPHRLLWPLVQRGVLLDLAAWRAETLTAELFAELCDRAGLACFGQEKISWERGYYLTDTLSLFTPRGSRWDRPPSVLRNPCFRREARRMATVYAARGRQGSPETSPS